MYPLPAIASGADLLQAPVPAPSHQGFPNRLTRKESELLALLQRHAGQCLTREFLLRTIWSYQGQTRTRTLDVHIQRLRRKLGPKLACRILTIFRTGYCWRHEGNGDLN
jgi:DNA-binding response OmpR family regulator